MGCTWVDCLDEAEVPQISQTGETWANLCSKHDCLLTEAITEGSPQQILSRYVKAGGGAKATTKRVMDASKTNQI